MLRGLFINLENGEALYLANADSQGAETGFMVDLLQLDFLAIRRCQKFVEIDKYVHNTFLNFQSARL